MKLHYFFRFSLISLLLLSLFLFVLYLHWFNTGILSGSMKYDVYTNGSYMIIDPVLLRLKISLFSVVYAIVFMIFGGNGLNHWLKRFYKNKIIEAEIIALLLSMITFLVDISLGGMNRQLPIHLYNDLWLQFGLLGTSLFMSFWLAWGWGKTRH